MPRYPKIKEKRDLILSRLRAGDNLVNIAKDIGTYQPHITRSLRNDPGYLPAMYDSYRARISAYTELGDMNQARWNEQCASIMYPDQFSNPMRRRLSTVGPVSVVVLPTNEAGEDAEKS